MSFFIENKIKILPGPLRDPLSSLDQYLIIEDILKHNFNIYRELIGNLY